VLDRPGITRQCRLLVLESKASEDLQLPVETVDYRLRARRHQRQGDFQGDGYCAGVPIDPQPPLVWLVSPGLRFHSARDTLLKYLSPEIRVTRIGLAENWHRGLKIIFRHGMFYRTGNLSLEKKEGKRPGLSQNHFPGCVLEAIERLDACGGKRLH
jgi:hypothetical protein